MSSGKNASHRNPRTRHSETTLTPVIQTDCGPKFGTACWLEVPVTDVSRAAAFYSAVLGWNCDDPENAKPPVLEGSSGVHFFNKDILHGAFVKVPEVPSVVNTSNLALSPILLNFMVNSIDETLDKVKSAGGKVHV